MLPSDRRLGAALTKRARFALVLLSLSFGSPAHTEAQERANGDAPTQQLTSRGRLLASGEIGGSWSDDHSGSLGQLKHWHVYASPSLTYFLRDRIGLGLTLGGGSSSTEYGTFGTYGSTYRDSDLFVGVLAAFDLPLSTRLSLLFRPGLHYSNQWRKSSQRPFFASGSQELVTNDAFVRPLHMQILRVVLSAQLVVRLSPYVALALGPDLWTDVILDDGGLRKAQSLLTRDKQKYVRVQLGLSAGLLVSF